MAIRIHGEDDDEPEGSHRGSDDGTEGTATATDWDLSDERPSRRAGDGFGPMSDDRRGEVSGPILTFDISASPPQRADQSTWRAMVEQFTQAAMAVRDLPRHASDLERLQVTSWALRSAERLHLQVRAEAETTHRPPVA